MFRHALRPLMISAALLVSAHAASAESRLALVIGQSAYKSVQPLPNLDSVLAGHTDSQQDGEQFGIA